MRQGLAVKAVRRLEEEMHKLKNIAFIITYVSGALFFLVIIPYLAFIYHR